MSVGEAWCGWFYTPVRTSHALTVYLHSTFTVPPIGDTIGIQWNICTTSFFVEIVNMLRPLAIFVEELHCVSLTECLTGFLMGPCPITCYSWKKILGEALHHWMELHKGILDSWTPVTRKTHLLHRQIRLLCVTNIRAIAHKSQMVRCFPRTPRF